MICEILAYTITFSIENSDKNHENVANYQHSKNIRSFLVSLRFVNS